MLAPRQRRLSSAATDANGRLKSIGSEGKRSPSLESGSPPVTSHMDCSMEYLAVLVKEKKQLEMFPNAFQHADRLVEDEIARVRVALFQTDFVIDEVDLPEPKGEVVTVTEKIYVPIRDYPDYNFVGRILGPRGMTAKQLEQETGCKIMVRGKGSMKDKRKEEANRGRPNWEHLDDDLHVLLQCEDTENRARMKLAAAMTHVKKLLVPAPEGTDELKRKQLMELAIINGTYRPYHKSNIGMPPEGLSTGSEELCSISGGRVITPVPLMSPMRGQLFVSPTSSPTPASTYVNDCLQTTTPSYLKNAPAQFDCSPYVSPALLESALANLASFQLSDLNLANLQYPTATSLINSFPNLFASSHSAPNGGSTSSSPISPK
ncbi:unnamed protein product [Auanema sp. JU1783]|nr:unnamed protein product [Auanema sp. JU1783]